MNGDSDGVLTWSSTLCEDRVTQSKGTHGFIYDVEWFIWLLKGPKEMRLENQGYLGKRDMMDL